MRSQESWVATEDFPHFFFRPNMVSGGNDINAYFDQALKRIRLNAGAVGGVFPVGDNKINAIFGFNPAQAVVNGVTARFADDVADEKNVHGFPGCEE
jgi:hypothetical protein